MLQAELGPLWGTSASQIYLAIGRMVRDGFVTTERVRQESRPDRQLLMLTRRGRELAERWLLEPGPAAELPVRLAVARVAARGRFIEVAEAIAEERAASLRQLRELLASVSGGFQREAVEAEMARTRAELRWVNSVLDRAEEIRARPPGRRRPAAVERHA